MGKVNVSVGQVAVAAAVGAFTLSDECPEPYAGNMINDMNDASYEQAMEDAEFFNQTIG